jgi:alanyl-tRNA synthetase
MGDGVVAKIDTERRKAAQRNHTATHLLHAALRSVLGGHVRQSGSLVSPERLRFDFAHYEPLSEDDVRAVEDMVNARILDDLPVKTSMEAFEQAKARGAIALFGEKYGEEVRMVEIENASCELCGGTHAASTGEIGSFRVLWESGIAAGTRRIEAVTGYGAVELGRQAGRDLEKLSSLLKVPARDLEDGTRKMLERLRSLEKEIGELRQRVAGSEVDDILKGASDVRGVMVVAARVAAPDLEVLKHLADRLQERLGDGVVCLGAVVEERAAIVVSVGAGLVKDRGLSASPVAKKLGELVGGRGGGKATFAQAGGKDVDALDRALGRCREVIADLVK